MVREEAMELPTRKMVAEYLERSLQEQQEMDYLPDAITYAGTGEPTLHPEFSGIVEDTLRLRDKYSPASKVSILSNASMIHKKEVFQALLKLDNNIQKLDAGNEELFRLMNNPIHKVNYPRLVEDLKHFNGKVIIQSMFLRGHYHDRPLDNTTAEAVSQWLERIREIGPEMVMIYSIARATPAHGLIRIPENELNTIAEKIRDLGLGAAVYG